MPCISISLAIEVSGAGISFLEEGTAVCVYSADLKPNVSFVQLAIAPHKSNPNAYALGTLLRVSYSGSTSDEHTMILVGRDSTGVIIYHANWPDNGTVAISHVTWSGFAQTFPYLDFIICPHNVNVWKPYSSTQHRGACTACGTYLYGSHYAQVGGMGTCLVCGYYGNMPGLTSTGHETE